MYKNPRYEFVVNKEKRTIVALTSFAGKTVSGIAKCHPSDSFNEEAGKALAKARADFKVAVKRSKYANKRLEIADNLFNHMLKERDFWLEYTVQSNKELHDASKLILKLKDEI